MNQSRSAQPAKVSGGSTATSRTRALLCVLCLSILAACGNGGGRATAEEGGGVVHRLLEGSSLTLSPDPPSPSSVVTEPVLHPAPSLARKLYTIGDREISVVDTESGNQLRTLSGQGDASVSSVRSRTSPRPVIRLCEWSTSRAAWSSGNIRYPVVPPGPSRLRPMDRRFM
jgi:hypothetical protein